MWDSLTSVRCIKKQDGKFKCRLEGNALDENKEGVLAYETVDGVFVDKLDVIVDDKGIKFHDWDDKPTDYEREFRGYIQTLGKKQFLWLKKGR